MCPGDFVLLDEFPLTLNGKIDKKALPKPNKASQKESTANLSILTKEEELLLVIWKEVVGIEKISVQDDFFILGGHSLIAVQMMTRLEKKTRIRLPMAILMVHSTLEQLASFLTHHQHQQN